MINSPSMRSMVEEAPTFPPPESIRLQARIRSLEQYREMVRRSLEDPDRFWGDLAEDLHWYKKWDKIREGDFENTNIRWFVGGKINASANCLDRHLTAGRADKIALLWEGESGETRTYTYTRLQKEVHLFVEVTLDGV